MISRRLDRVSPFLAIPRFPVPEPGLEARNLQDLPFTITFGTLGTFIATVDVGDLTQHTHAESFDISGYFIPAGTLAHPGGFTETSADLFFSLSQSVSGGLTSTTGSTSLFRRPATSFLLSFPPPPPTVPEPSSLALPRHRHSGWCWCSEPSRQSIRAVVEQLHKRRTASTLSGVTCQRVCRGNGISRLPKVSLRSEISSSAHGLIGSRRKLGLYSPQ